MDQERRRRRTVRIVLLSLLGLGVLTFMWLLDGVFGPLLLALLLAYILNPVVNWIQKLHVARGAAIGLLFLGFYALFVGTLVLTVPAFLRQVMSLYQATVGEREVLKREIDPGVGEPGLDAPDRMRFVYHRRGYTDLNFNGKFEPEEGEREFRNLAQLNEVERKAIVLDEPEPDDVVGFIDSNQNGRYDPEGYLRVAAARIAGMLEYVRQEHSEEYDRGVEEVRQKLMTYGTGAAKTALDTLTGVIFTFFGLLTVFVLVPIYLFYFLMGLSTMRDRVAAMLPGKHRERILDILTQIDESVSAFFRGRLIIMLIKAVLTGGALEILGVPFGLVVGVITGIGSLIPIAGFLMGLVPGVTIALLDSGSPGLAATVAGIFIAIEVFENYLLTPWILKDRVGLHPVTLILSVFLAGALFGFVGMLLAVPMASVVKILFKEFVLPWIEAFAEEKPEPEP